METCIVSGVRGAEQWLCCCDVYVFGGGSLLMRPRTRSYAKTLAFGDGRGMGLGGFNVMAGIDRLIAR